MCLTCMRENVLLCISVKYDRCLQEKCIWFYLQPLHAICHILPLAGYHITTLVSCHISGPFWNWLTNITITCYDQKQSKGQCHFDCWSNYLVEIFSSGLLVYWSIPDISLLRGQLMLLLQSMLVQMASLPHTTSDDTRSHHDHHKNCPWPNSLIILICDICLSTHGIMPSTLHVLPLWASCVVAELMRSLFHTYRTTKDKCSVHYGLSH